MSGSFLNAQRSSLQDRDLFQRMNHYFDGLDSRLSSGEGWLIFNANPRRAGNIVRFIQQQMTSPPEHTWFYVPWRDFSLTAYMVEVELQSIAGNHGSLTGERKREAEIATKVSRQTMVRMVTDELLVISGISLRHVHEVRYLMATIEARYMGRLATIMLTPDAPHELQANVSRWGEAGHETWEKLSGYLYGANLVAV
jgi:hypothetical protein